MWTCRYGFQGFYNPDIKPLVLTPQTVDGIQLQGGTILGTSRGGANIREIVKRLDMWGVNMLFVVGGNGGNAGANAIHEMCMHENVMCAVVGIPKSIDNDILLVRPSPHPSSLLWAHGLSLLRCLSSVAAGQSSAAIGHTGPASIMSRHVMLTDWPMRTNEALRQGRK